MIGETINDGFCLVCGLAFDEDQLCLHHIVSRGAGGSNDLGNLITVCKQCHHKIHTGEVNIIDVLGRYRSLSLWRWTEVYNFLKGKKDD